MKKMARNVELCDKCINDRLLTKIMAGIADEEAREELLERYQRPTWRARLILF